MKPLYIDIEKDTIENINYRRVIHTTPYNQVVLMSLEAGEDIPEEVHPTISQFIRVEKGNGKAVIDGKEYQLKDGISINIPAGSKHYITQIGNDPLKLYTVYSPAEHPEELIQPRQINYIKQIPRDILQLTYGYLDDADLTKACLISKDFNNKLCNSDVWVRKIMYKYPLSREEIDKYKGNNNYAAYYMHLKPYENMTPRNLLWFGVSRNREDLVYIAIKRGADVNGNYSMSLLTETSIIGNVEIVRMLLENGIKIGRTNHPLSLAIWKGHVSLAKFLLEYGFKPTAENLTRAQAEGNTEIIELLQQYI